MLTLQLLVSGPLMVLIVILTTHALMRQEQRRALRRWHSVATFSFFFAPLYCLLAAVFLEQMAIYMASPFSW